MVPNQIIGRGHCRKCKITITKTSYIPNNGARQTIFANFFIGYGTAILKELIQVLYLPTKQREEAIIKLPLMHISPDKNYLGAILIPPSNRS
jgi:hypothetical protein